MNALLQYVTFYHLCEELGSAKEAKKAMKDADKKKTKGVMKKDNINADIREVVKK